MTLGTSCLIRGLVGLCALLMVTGSSAAPVELNPDHPSQYTVVKGDTLWDISGRFLKSPWRWPEIWKANTSIENPHLIYPGDVIVLSMVNGVPELRVLQRKTVKLSPSVYAEPLREAIPTIPPGAILPFLSEGMVLPSAVKLQRAGYITAGVEDSIVFGKYSKIYARGLRKPDVEHYQVFRPGRAFRHPETGEELGFEGFYLGDARMITYGDPSTLEITKSRQEIVAEDRLVAAPEDTPAPYFQPMAPEGEVHGYVLAVDKGVAETGRNEVVILSIGEREGVQPGHVLRVFRNAGKAVDPVKRGDYRLPEESSGLLMVFRTFEKVSYGLIMNSIRSIHVNDVVRQP